MTIFASATPSGRGFISGSTAEAANIIVAKSAAPAIACAANAPRTRRARARTSAARPPRPKTAPKSHGQAATSARFIRLSRTTSHGRPTIAATASASQIGATSSEPRRSRADASPSGRGANARATSSAASSASGGSAGRMYEISLPLETVKKPKIAPNQHQR